MSTLLVDDEHDIRRISFNRPEQLNALHREDVRAATNAVNGLPSTAKALVFTGAGERAFSGWVHIDSFAGLPSERGAPVDHRARRAARRRTPRCGSDRGGYPRLLHRRGI